MLHSPTPTQDERVRHLLDERTRRADLDLEHSSVSEFTDSPSLYQFSPRQSSPQPRSSSRGESLRPPGPPRPSYDLSEMPASPTSYRSSYQHPLNDDAPPFLYHEQGRFYAAESIGADTTVSRMSFLGPKMRIHSPAPWELGEGSAHGDDEQDASDSTTFSDGRSMFGVKKRGRSRTVDSASRKDSLPRPSVDSSWSQSWSKKSFEGPPSEHSAIHALAQASMSSTSLTMSTASSQTSQRPAPKRPSIGVSSAARKLSLKATLISPTPSIRPPLPSPSGTAHLTSLTQPSPRRTHPFTEPPVHDLDTRGSTPSPSPTLRSVEFVHPYANPDVVPQDRDVRFLPVDSSVAAQGVTRSDSSTTITLSDDSSCDVRSFQHAADAVQPWETPAPGTGTFRIPLISLEEARDRVRGVSAGSVPYGTGSNTETSECGPRPVKGRPRSSSFGANGAKTLIRQTVLDEPAVPTVPPLPAGPSTPARSETETSFLSQPSQLPPVVVSGRMIKHKKSGLMNKLSLFSTKDPRQGAVHFVPVSPAPPLPMNHGMRAGFPAVDHRQETKPGQVFATRAQHSQYVAGETTTNPRPIRRVPVPILTSNIASGTRYSSVKGDDTSSSVKPVTEGASMKRPPPLNVVITSPSVERQGRASAVDVPSASTAIGNTPFSYRTDDAPRSAPPGTTAFASLRLRPVSTVFSAHFADHLLDSKLDSEEPGDYPSTGNIGKGTRISAEIETPSTSTSTDSLLTPISFSSSSNTLAAVSETLKSDGTSPATVIRALQDLITSSRKTWQRQIWELEGQVRDLQAEAEELRAAKKQSHCETCGRSIAANEAAQDTRVSVLDRPRAKTSIGSRFGSGR